MISRSSNEEAMIKRCAKVALASTMLAMALLALAAGTDAAKAQAAFGFEPGGSEMRLEDDAGNPVTQAASHPNLTTRIVLETRETEFGFVPTGTVKDIRVDLPPGLLGNVSAIPTCTQAQLSAGGNPGFPPQPECPASSQIGFIELYGAPCPVIGGCLVIGQPLPVFNMERGKDVPAVFGFSIGVTTVVMKASVEPGRDYSIRVSSTDIPQSFALHGLSLTLWGMPADHNGPPTIDPETGIPSWENPGSGPRVAFIRNRAACPGGTEVGLEGAGWEDLGALRDFESTSIPAATGCENLQFQPLLDLAPDNRRAAAPAGFQVDLEVPQAIGGSNLEVPPVKDVTVTLPEGVHISPAAAAGLLSCTDSALSAGSAAPEQCPEAAKIGSVAIDSPLLDEPLAGSVYIGSQQSSDPQSGDMYRMFVTAFSSGVRVKLKGAIRVDPASGRVTAEFSDNPQLPLSKLRMTLSGGPKAVLVTPQDCGTHSSSYSVTSWGGQTVSGTSSFVVDQGCGTASLFDPTIAAGSRSAAAGGYSQFALRVIRPDGQQNLSRIEATLPKGLLAKLAGVPLCSDAAAASASCPDASQVGRVVVGTGAGAAPLYLPEAGKAPTGLYLAGPHKGAPYSLVAKVPAQAGPFDLGTVVVRNALHVDPVTAQVTSKSDPLPQILQGVPISYRDVRVQVTRERFTLNPTSCEPMVVASQIVSAAGATASPSARFQVSGCDRLGFKPKLSLRLKGKTNRSAHPALTATLKARKGDANIGKAVVTLPKTQFLEQDHIRTICTRVQYAEGNCPKASIYGYAKAWTPLLDQPLQGPVYLRSSSNKLPDLVADLDGQIEIDLAGRIDSVNSRMRTTFWAVPDAPVSKFVLRMQGGKKGLLVNNTELCRGKPRAKAAFTGHNGKRSVSNPLVKVGCGKSGR